MGKSVNQCGGLEVLKADMNVLSIWKIYNCSISSHLCEICATYPRGELGRTSDAVGMMCPMDSIFLYQFERKDRI